MDRVDTISQRTTQARKTRPRVVYDTDFLLLDGLSEASPTTVAAARKIASLIDHAELLGDLHTRLEERDAPPVEATAAETIWQDARDRALMASQGLVDDESAPGDATARLIVFLRTRVLFATRRSEWRPLSADEAIETLEDAMPGAEEELADALRYALKNMAPANRDLETVLARQEWIAARNAYFAARDALHAMGDAATEEAFAAVASSLERWESLTPPDQNSLAFVMRESIAFNGLHWSFQSVDCPWTMRDLLDGGSAHETFAARYYMHVLRMLGSENSALLTPPIAGLYPGVDQQALASADTHDMKKAWERQHAQMDPWPNRIAELAEWNAPSDGPIIAGRAPLRSKWDHGAALHNHARALLEEYEALGGRFNVVRGDDGRTWFGTAYPRDATERANEIELLINRKPQIREAIGHILDHRARRDQTATQAERLPLMAAE